TVTVPSAWKARKLSTSFGSSGLPVGATAPSWARAHRGSADSAAKLTISAPPAFRRSRRDMAVGVFMAASSRARRTQHGAQNARVGAASTEVSGQALLRLIERTPGRVCQLRRGRHDHAARAIAALAGLLGN